ncbi:MAG TPA: glycosyltransferase family 4 protein [Stellaceae bacterium]|nr:glycosyltransferase family 4 protein [Stellaceae bacterium]
MSRGAAASHRPAAVIAAAPPDYDLASAVAGRKSASAGFLAAYIRHGGQDRLTCLAQEPEHGAAFREFVAAQGRVDQVVDIVESLALPPIDAIGTVYTPGPDLGRHAWLRRSGGQRRFSLVGVTHTLSESAAQEAVGNLLTTPVQPWDALVCTSAAAKAAVARTLEEYGEYFRCLVGAKLLCRAQLPVIPLGVDCDAFVAAEGARSAFRARHDIPQEAVVLLYVGRLDHAEKANPVPLYIAAQNVAERMGRPVHLLEIGWFRSDFFAEAFAQAAAVLAPSVKRVLLDSREADHRRGWFAADIFVSLADSVQETFGLTPIEAMAAGLPVVVSDWDGYRDTVRDGIDGFRIPTLMSATGSGETIAFDYAAGNANHTMFSAAAAQSSAVDVPACADALHRLIGDAELRCRMGAAARERARQVFDWRHVIAAYQELWRELAERRRSAPEAAAPAPRQPARPLAMDPFELFHSWSSANLAAETRLDLPDGVTPALVDAMRQLQAATPMPAALLDRAEISRLVETLSTGPTTAGDLIALLEPSLRPAGWRSLTWLAKTAMIRWR